ncbi:hypothetical protein N7535_001981 [Penicillium sp. DV-2018c]|nr:hypothetical protein N7461_004774 [Penicillium sp. DV-2018c]KAJ5583361.1 hypothetical protein N7535_001981 [Penicillium sp. DV-2018c]
MSPTLEIFTLVLLSLLLGLTTVIITVLVKEWTEYKAAQFWPKPRSARPLDLESGFFGFLHRDVTELTWRVDQLERERNFNNSMVQIDDLIF